MSLHITAYVYAILVACVSLLFLFKLEDRRGLDYGCLFYILLIPLVGTLTFKVEFGYIFMYILAIASLSLGYNFRVSRRC